MCKCILFVPDALRTDAYPQWFKDKHQGLFFPMFLSANETSLSFTSIFLGRNVLTDRIPIKYPWAYGYLWKKLPGKTIADVLEGVATVYFYSDEEFMHKCWWSKQKNIHLIGNVDRLKDADDYLLIWHTFETHSKHGDYPHKFTGTYEERKKCKEEYEKQVHRTFKDIDRIVELLEPDYFAVMGDHGEEFYVDGYEGDSHKRETGHGTYKHSWIITRNVLYPPLHVVDNKSKLKKINKIVSYEYLNDEILRWYK